MPLLTLSGITLPLLTSPLIHRTSPSPLLRSSVHLQQATNAAALLALFSLQSHMPLHRHLARPYADIWTHLQEQASE